MAVKAKSPYDYLDLPAGKIASVQTFLEMRERPPPRRDPPGVAASLRRVVAPNTEWYLALFHKVGDSYLWFSRLAMNREELQTLINDPLEEIYAVEQGGSEAGLLELDLRTPYECEIVYFALTATHVGAGTGRWLMNRTIEFTWSRPIPPLGPYLQPRSPERPRFLPTFRVRSIRAQESRSLMIPGSQVSCRAMPLPGFPYSRGPGLRVPRYGRAHFASRNPSASKNGGASRKRSTLLKNARLLYSVA